jgi:hypothetical protein
LFDWTLPIRITKRGAQARLGFEFDEADRCAWARREGKERAGAFSCLAALLSHAAKRLEPLHEAVPAATLIALLMNPTNSQSHAILSDLQSATRTLGPSGRSIRTQETQSGAIAEKYCPFSAIHFRSRFTERSLAGSG